MSEAKKENKLSAFYQKHKNIILEILRFLLVGGLATVIDFLVFELCFYLIFASLNETLNIVLSTTCGFVVGLIFNYIFSIIFVFKGAKEDKKTQTIQAFLLFTLIGVIGLGIKIGIQTGGNYLMNLLFVDVEGFWAWFIDTFVYGVATLIVLVWNYIGRKLFIFKGESKE